HEYVRLGGAANVAHNLAALGAAVSLVGTIGRDDAARRLRSAMAAARVGDDGLVEDVARPTVEKVRIVTDRNQQVARIDYEEDAEVDVAIESRLIERIARLGSGSKAVIVSDYLKGTVTPALMASLVALKQSAAHLIV